MPSINHSDNWESLSLGTITAEECERVGRLNPRPIVLSSTKHHGLVSSDDYFKNRAVYSDDLSSYKLVHNGWFAYATNHLTEGSIGLQSRYQIGCVSPIYTVFSCRKTVHPPYLYRLLKSDTTLRHYAIHDQASVDRRGAVRYRDFSKIGVLVPPISEQRRIAEVFDIFDERIAAERQYVEKARNVYLGLIDEAVRDSIEQASLAMYNLADLV